LARQTGFLSGTADTAKVRPTIRLLQRVVEVRAEEVRALGLACAYFFCLLAAWFIMRPIREEMGIAGGTKNLPWLYTGTLLTTLAVHPPFAALVARLPRGRFITFSNRFFLANILVFFVLFRTLPEAHSIWIGRVFFVWTSVFNLFVVSLFWAFMVDTFRTEQAKRLFGFIGVGGTVGGIAGASVTAIFAKSVGPLPLFLVSAALLELAVQCVRRLDREPSSTANSSQPRPPGEAEDPIGGRTFAGISHVLRSPYLLNICLYMLLFTVGSTMLYFQQAQIVEGAFPRDPGAQTSFFANVDLAVNILTLLTQMLLTGRLMKWLGVSVMLALLPALSVAGYLALGAGPVLGVFVVFQVLRRSGEYAVARPSREVLYTVLPREDKYKAKHFIDTFVYRSGDQLGAWSMASMAAAGIGLAGTAFVAAPLAALWLAVAVWLGRRQRAMAQPANAPTLAS
jgi:AAA family ATP:ADP antiporter